MPQQRKRKQSKVKGPAKLGAKRGQKPSAPSPKAGTQLSFDSKLENWAAGMDYCAIPVPASITKALGTKSAVLVMARVNSSEPFKVSLFPAGGGQHYIRVRAKVRREANLKEGDRVNVRITSSTAPTSRSPRIWSPPSAPKAWPPTSMHSRQGGGTTSSDASTMHPSLKPVRSVSRKPSTKPDGGERLG